MSGYIGTAPVPQATQNREVFTATAGQTSFATLGYSPTFLDVYMNGIHLLNGTDYTATNGSDVVLVEAASAGDVLEVLSFTPFVTDKFSGVTATSEQLNTLVDNSPSYRNLIINGEMSVAQRGASATGVTTSGSGDYHTVDRIKTTILNIGAFDITQEADGPDGFANSLKYTCSTADASPVAGAALIVSQRLTGRDLQKLKKGLASASSVTLGFKVKSNKTGTYVVELYDTDNARHIAATYTISVADSWTPITLTFIGDTTGTFIDDVSTALQVNFWMGSGADFVSGATPTSWAAAVNANRAAGLSVNLADTIGNYWQVTGIQFEEGTIATEFEHMSYEQHLIRCLPYYWRLTSDVTDQTIGIGSKTGTTLTFYAMYFPVPMIQPPHTFEHTGTPSDYLYIEGATTQICTADPNSAVPGRDCVQLRFTGPAGAGGGTSTLMRITTLGAYLAWSAEL